MISKYGLPSAGFPQAALRSSFFMITTAFIAGCSFFCPSTASSIFSKIPFKFQKIEHFNLLSHFFSMDRETCYFEETIKAIIIFECVRVCKKGRHLLKCRLLVRLL